MRNWVRGEKAERQNLLMVRPSKLPSMRVIGIIGMSTLIFFQAIRINAGRSTRNEIKIPLKAGGSGKVEVDIRKPDTTQSENAESFASQVSFWGRRCDNALTFYSFFPPLTISQ